MSSNYEATLPSYMIAADVHNIANGKSSITDDLSVVDSVTRFSLSAVARGVTSAFNTVPAVTNYFGLTDIPEWQTEDLLSSFDDDLSAYYVENRDTIDVVGDIAASFVPGMAAVKTLNYAQKGLAGLQRGSAGKNILQSIGALESKADKILIPQAKEKILSGDAFALTDSSVIKAFGTKYAQNVLEAGVFEVAAASTMGEYSPLFKEHTATDILYNSALGGGLIGGGILGTVSAVQTYGALRRAKDVADKALNKIRRVAESPEGVDSFVKILNWKAQLDAPAPELLDEASRRAYDAKKRDLGLSIQEELTKVGGGDADLAASLYKSLQGMDQNAAWAATLHMKEVGRAGLPLASEATVLKATKLKEQQARLKQGSDDWFEIEDELDKLREVNVKYVRLADGAVQHTTPVVLKMADRMDASALQATLAKAIVRAGDNWSPVGKSLDEVESRYIKADMMTLEEGVHIGGNDLPILEAAWNKGIKEVVIDGVLYDRTGMWHHIKTKKEALLDEMLKLSDVDPKFSSQKVAASLNLKESLVESGAHTVDDIDTSAWMAKTDHAATYTQPEWMKAGYGRNVGVDGNVERGMVVIKQLQNVQEAENLKAITAVLGEEAVAKLIKLSDVDVLSTTSAGAGAGLASFASGEYLTTASKVEWIGKMTNLLKTQKSKEINETFQSVMHSVLQNQDAGLEIVALRQAILSTGEKYVWVNGEAVHHEIAKYENQIANGSKRAVRPALAEGVAERIPVNTMEARTLMDEWIRYNNNFLEKEMTLKNAIGRGMGDYTDVIHFPQPDSKKFKFFSFVVPKNPAEGEKVQMIWAANPESLAQLESKVDSNYTVLHKSDTDRFYKAQQQYDYDLGMSSYEVRSDLKRTGVAAPFFPITDPQRLLEDMLSYRHTVSDRQIRDAVSLHNSTAFSEFKRLDSEFTALQKSTKGAVNVDSPYESYVKTALDIPRSAHVPVWTQFNNMAEDVYSRTIGKLGDAWKGLKSPAELSKVNNALEEAGIRGFKDSATELWANHPAGAKVLSEHVQTMNSVVATTILRLDPMNALNNGVGATILTGSETAHIFSLAKQLGVEDKMNAIASVGVPGTPSRIKSPTRLYADSIGDFFNLVMGNKEMGELKKFYDSNGWMPSFADQMRQVVDNSTLSGVENASTILGKTSALLKAGSDWGEKWTGNKAAEEMNRFIAARIAHKLSNVIVEAGGMTKQEQLAFINTFVNRTQGNYQASQRPMMFQGPVGHAISLFQTYQFNMMQHMFRHIADGSKKKAAMLMGLQTSIYGMNGLPAFQFMNQTLIGNAAGNTEHEDAYSYLRRAGDVGDWLMYGSLANATGLGLYSRGDLNPRHLTIVPTAPEDIPFVSATRNFFGSIWNSGKEIAGGAAVPSTILRGLEHSGISRPLAGLATTLQGFTSEDGLSYSTSQKNHLMTTWDTYSLASLQRIAGARPFEEALTRDAFYRVQAYESKDQDKINRLGSVVRDRVRSGDIPSADEYNSFLESYVKAGGDQKGFIRFWQKQIKDANVSKIDEMADHGRSRYSNYLQTMMDGYDPTTGQGEE